MLNVFRSCYFRVPFLVLFYYSVVFLTFPFTPSVFFSFCFLLSNNLYQYLTFFQSFFYLSFVFLTPLFIPFLFFSSSHFSTLRFLPFTFLSFSLPSTFLPFSLLSFSLHHQTFLLFSTSIPPLFSSLPLSKFPLFISFHFLSFIFHLPANKRYIFFFF